MKKIYITLISCIAICTFALLFSVDSFSQDSRGAKKCSWLQVECPNGRIIELCVEEIGDGSGCDCGDITRKCDEGQA